MEHIRLITTDILIIGCGIAGLSAAIHGAEDNEVVVISKGKIRDTATQYAQGGIAAALEKSDAPSDHYDDTLAAGAGLCQTEAVRVLVEEGPQRVNELIQMGAVFDRNKTGQLAFTREAAHKKRRILHAGDATGKEIERTLGQVAIAKKNIRFLSNTSLSHLLVTEGICSGAIVVQNDQTLVRIIANATIIATGGCGQLFECNSNPSGSTGDGIVCAYQAGAELQDLEFTQFHPTTLYLGDKKPISIFLISEAVRGEGALLRNRFGERFMPNYHTDAELAPRDVVARAIYNECERTDSHNVFLDLSTVKVDIEVRFPTIFKRCMEANIDCRRDIIPVAPAAHYFMGGIKTDLWGQTNLKRLYAAGEAACVGVHGANRLASNSLLDGLVFGYRAAKKARNESPLDRRMRINNDDLKTVVTNSSVNQKQRHDILAVKQKIKQIMWKYVGIIRHEKGLIACVNELNTYEWIYDIASMETDIMEVKHMLMLGKMMAEAALKRHESRGAHFRSDFPKRSSAWEGKRLISQRYARVEIDGESSLIVQ